MVPSPALRGDVRVLVVVETVVMAVEGVSRPPRLRFLEGAGVPEGESSMSGVLGEDWEESLSPLARCLTGVLERGRSLAVNAWTEAANERV